MSKLLSPLRTEEVVLATARQIKKHQPGFYVNCRGLILPALCVVLFLAGIFVLH